MAAGVAAGGASTSAGSGGMNEAAAPTELMPVSMQAISPDRRTIVRIMIPRLTINGIVLAAP